MGAQPLPSPYIYLRFGLPKTHEFLSFLAQPYPSPSSSLAMLGEALLEYHALHHHHTVVLLLDGVFLKLSLSPC